MRAVRKEHGPALLLQEGAGLATDDSQNDLTIVERGMTPGSVRAEDADLTFTTRSGSSPPGAATHVHDEIAEAIATGLANLAASIDARSDDNPYVIAEALEKTTYALDTAPVAPALHRIAEALEAMKPRAPIGLWVMVLEENDSGNAIYIQGEIIGRDPDGKLWIADQSGSGVFDVSISDKDGDQADGNLHASYFLDRWAFDHAIDEHYRFRAERKVEQKAASA
jgi:hypothetical protein